MAQGCGEDWGGGQRSGQGLTQVVCDLVRVPQVLHAEADDAYEVLHQPEELLGVGTHLRPGGGGQGASEPMGTTEGNKGVIEAHT